MIIKIQSSYLKFVFTRERATCSRKFIWNLRWNRRASIVVRRGRVSTRRRDGCRCQFSSDSDKTIQARRRQFDCVRHGYRSILARLLSTVRPAAHSVTAAGRLSLEFSVLKSVFCFVIGSAMPYSALNRLNLRVEKPSHLIGKENASGRPFKIYWLNWVSTQHVTFPKTN